MRLSLHDEATGRVEDFRPAEPPVCRWRAETSGEKGSLGRLRGVVLADAVERTLGYFGCRLTATPSGEDGDLYFGAERPAARALWLKPRTAMPGAPSEPEAWAKDFDALDLRLWCLKTHYRRPPAFTWGALEEARRERLELTDIAGHLDRAGGALAPNSTGLAGYKKRFRDSLARDLDFPEAWTTLWDALRPGALSPGSRSGAIKDADQVFGLLRVG